MDSYSSGLAQRIAPWLLAIALAMALLQAYRMNPVEELHIGVEHRDAVPPCRTNPIQIFDAATPAVSPDICWAKAGDRVIWTFPNNPDRPFHVHMSPQPFTANPSGAFDAYSSKGVVVSDPVRPTTDYTVFKYVLSYDGGKKRIDPHVVILK